MEIEHRDYKALKEEITWLLSHRLNFLYLKVDTQRAATRFSAQYALIRNVL